MLMVHPAGKWLQIAFEASSALVVLSGSEDQPRIAHVLAAGPEAKTPVGARILFRKNAAEAVPVGEETIILLHEDYVLAILEP